ncbi:quinolinate synthase A [Arthrobacter sp. Hiyo4]|nr:quinolinate synthase A [Arthrobacter sp. Hiyo4]
MSSVNTAIQLITREQAESAARSAAAGKTASTCSPALAKGPWEYDLAEALAGAPPTARRLERGRCPGRHARQGQLPEEYKLATDAELDVRIRAAKAKLGDRAVILGHFYQRDEVIQYADFVGDSFQLANAALTRPDAEAIIFCGVHFMAETADILSTPEQAVILPNLAAGCSMADMADTDSVEECWEQLEEIFGTEADAGGGFRSFRSPT